MAALVPSSVEVVIQYKSVMPYDPWCSPPSLVVHPMHRYLCPNRAYNWSVRPIKIGITVAGALIGSPTQARFAGFSNFVESFSLLPISPGGGMSADISVPAGDLLHNGQPEDPCHRDGQ